MKINILLLPFEVTRPIWNFSENQIICLRTGECNNQIQGFFGYKFDNKTDAEIKDDVIKLHRTSSKINFYQKDLNYNIKVLIKKSAFAYLSYFLIFKRNNKINESINTIEQLISSGENKGTIFLVPHRGEVKNGKIQWSNLSKKIISNLAKKKKNLSIKECNLEYKDYLKNDGHPNKIGYSKISECIFDTIKKNN